jgi:tRNA modification GTPase
MTQDQDTIVALATATNTIGAISIVRLSGTLSLDIALKITQKTKLQPRYATLSKIYDQDKQLIDEAIVIYFQNPYSFTGEDIVEFQLHGGVAIADIVLQNCIYHGARIAQAGEFSKRAYLNNKIDLSQAYAISKLIEAKSKNSVKLLAKQLKGELKEFVDNIREDLMFMLAYTEVSIDYAEDDIPEDILEQIKQKQEQITIKLSQTLEASKRRENLIDGFKVAIVGKPNVGKSSLLNKLLNYNRAIVSNIAGTTRDTIEENIKIGDSIIKIIDTAGIRETNNEIEKIGIEKTKQTIQEADIIIALFDNNSIFSQDDKIILDTIQNSDKEKIFVITKKDLENKLNTSYIPNPIYIDTKKDISTLLDELNKIIKQSDFDDQMILISKFQIKSTKEALDNIIESKKFLETNELDFFAYHINMALQSISNITRPYEHDQLLDVMFGEFCLGK